ncbi:MAG: hypothetical protein E6R03_16920 [Hyphomicrobiaceae bacterium]|nr:MAG: hypothetical protein E6R03_16920 [Hyphomicrobiaceae bacterium]
MGDDFKTPPTINHVGEFFFQLRKSQFAAFVNEAGQAVIRDQLNRKRQLPDYLLDFAKANRLAIQAFLQNQPCWQDERGDSRCRQCNAGIELANVGDGGVATCLYKPQCPFRARGDT